MTGAFNPIHNGHLEMVQLALTALTELNYRVENVFFGLANQDKYLRNKVAEANEKNASHSYKHNPRTLFTRDERVSMVTTATRNRTWRPAGVRVAIDHHELDTNADHPAVVKTLKEKHHHDVILVAGEDLWERMREIWDEQNIPRIVVNRTQTSSFKNIKQAHTSKPFELFVQGNASTEDVSSTHISNSEDLKFLPESIKAMYTKFLAGHKKEDQSWKDYFAFHGRKQKK